MEIKESQKIDKSDWGDGPWQSEPDRIEFEHKGLSCLMARSKVGGNWCGYVAVGPDHPWHKAGYTSCTSRPICKKSKTDLYCEHTPENLIHVHGGLTYSDFCQGDICHVPKAGEPDNVKWFGFDCAHAGDGLPAMRQHLPKERGYFSQGYKDEAYVRREVRRLAEQLKAVAR